VELRSVNLIWGLSIAIDVDDFLCFDVGVRVESSILTFREPGTETLECIAVSVLYCPEKTFWIKQLASRAPVQDIETTGS
jgi:hypothetical protein